MSGTEAVPNEGDLPSLVSRTVLERFSKLPRNGKPSDKQWTVLAGFVAVPVASNGGTPPRLITLATGTKCLGQSQKNPSLVADSHAEVLARRLLNRQLFDEVRSVFSGKTSALLSDADSTGHCRWRKDSYNLYLYVSRVPCGDCAICDRDDFEGDETSSSGRTEMGDIYRTGAKPVGSGRQDPHGPGKDYHVTGLLRTKPGRGEPTDSMSCSDKIARWVACGLQSRFVAAFLSEPIVLSGLVIGGEIFDEDSIKRALVHRHSCPVDSLRVMAAPKEAVFFHDRKPNAEKCSTSVLVRSNLPPEVAVDGRRHGLTKKLIGTPKAELSVCRRQIFLAFRNLVEEMVESSDSVVLPGTRLADLLQKGYGETKRRATPSWLEERRRMFATKMEEWTVKEDPDFFI